MLQHMVEELRACLHKKKSHIKNLFEKTSEVKQRKQLLQQSISMVCWNLWFYPPTFLGRLKFSDYCLSDFICIVYFFQCFVWFSLLEIIFEEFVVWHVLLCLLMLDLSFHAGFIFGFFCFDFVFLGSQTWYLAWLYMILVIESSWILVHER